MIGICISLISRMHFYMEIVKREKRESLIFIKFMEKDLPLHYILDLYTYTHSWDPQYSKKIKGKDCTISNTPPQAGAYMSYAPSLLQMYLILGPLRDLVKMSVG